METPEQNKRLNVGFGTSMDPQERERVKDPKNPERRSLEGRLEGLLGKRVEGFFVSDAAEVVITLEDGTKLKFQSWNALDDEPDFDGVVVEK